MTESTTMIPHDALIEVTSAVCEALLGAAPVTRDVASATGERIYASVSIRGAWRGDVEVRLSPSMARRFAREAFQIEPGPSDDPVVMDMAGEVANMIGGNLKALLPEPCALSLPVVLRTARREGGDVVQAFALGDDAFEVVVASEDAP
jgi:chemotaxis protein CheX